MSRMAQTLALTGCLAAVALIGCNGVLGIDEAHSRDEEVSHSGAQLIPVPGCEAPTTDCAACVAGSVAFQTCLGDHACRKALDAYRACLGTKCDGATCFDTLLAGAGQPVADYVQGECSACVGVTPLASVCDLYCACMQQTLPPATKGGVADGKTCESFAGVPWQQASVAECKDACETLAKKDLGSVNCRWGHCELAANGEQRGHCSHAIDNSICPEAAVSDASCTDRSLPGWACERNQDCCSSHCTGNICAR
jgi:hypothetical protein